MEKLKIMFRLTLLLPFFLLASCLDRDQSLNKVFFDNISYQNQKHHSLNIVEGEFSKWQITNEARLLYVIDLDDSLWVSILEFKSDAFALAYYTNSGKFQGSIPVVKGDLLEQGIRSGRRLFSFKHKRFYNHDRRLLEQYVQQFPGYRGGLPQEFLSLPFEHREPGKTSIQIDRFHGVPILFPMFVQSYRNANLYWNVARSWESVSEEDWLSWVDSVSQNRKILLKNESILKFDSGNGTQAMVSRLTGGRVVCVWGPLDSKMLETLFSEISNRVYSAKY